MPSPAVPLRLGLIGCGYVSKYHIEASRAIGVPIVAVADPNPEAANAVAARLGATAFDNADALMESGLVDAVIIATPHRLHVPLAMRALDHRLHVLCEKPLAVSAADADLAIKAHAIDADLVFAVNFNHRAWPLWKSIKALLDARELGPLTRYQWTITDWYRTQWYYNQSDWRGTWTGEGGGVLVNQCPHELDMIAHLFGTPERVTARVRFGKHHHITVEDEVHAIFDHENGVTGSFIASTGEPTGSNRLEIIADRGIIRVTDETGYELTAFDTPASVHTRTNQTRSDPPQFTVRRVETGDHGGEYREILANFVRACQERTGPLASAYDARASIEIANAILLADDAGQSVTLPVDRAAFTRLLARKQREETGDPPGETSGRGDHPSYSGNASGNTSDSELNDTSILSPIDSAHSKRPR